MLILNIGAGDDSYGDIRADLYTSKTVNILCDVERGIPFKDKAFGEVYSKNLLEHLKNPFAALLEMKRVLKRGGHLIITTDNAAYLPFYLYPRSMHCGMGYKGRGEEDRHYAVFTRDHLLNMASALQMDLIGCSYEGFPELQGRKAVRLPMRILVSLVGFLRPWSHMTYPHIRIEMRRIDPHE